jgi:hypothetical protein
MWFIVVEIYPTEKPGIYQQFLKLGGIPADLYKMVDDLFDPVDNHMPHISTQTARNRLHKLSGYAAAF